jgi:hypothetical protein
MDQGPAWEADSSSAGQDIFHLQWYPNVCYCVVWILYWNNWIQSTPYFITVPLIYPPIYILSPKSFFP